MGYMMLLHAIYDEINVIGQAYARLDDSRFNSGEMLIGYGQCVDEISCEITQNDIMTTGYRK